MSAITITSKDGRLSLYMGVDHVLSYAFAVFTDTAISEDPLWSNLDHDDFGTAAQVSAYNQARRLVLGEHAGWITQQQWELLWRWAELMGREEAHDLTISDPPPPAPDSGVTDAQ